jgi:hypothetical protein
MSGIEDLKATREILRELARIANFTRQTLAAKLQERKSWPGPQPSGQLFPALEHLGEVREGFILSQRTSPSVSPSELRELVRRILLDWDWVEAMNMSLAPGQQVDLVDQQLVAYNHALVALAVLPHLPPEAVTFPQRRPTYRDLAPPVLPGDLLTRIEELEQMIYQAEFKPVTSLDYGPFRRTYAFFEASSWLVNNYLEPLLGD